MREKQVKDGNGSKMQDNIVLQVLYVVVYLWRKENAWESKIFNCLFQVSELHDAGPTPEADTVSPLTEGGGRKVQGAAQRGGRGGRWGGEDDEGGGGKDFRLQI